MTTREVRFSLMRSDGVTYARGTIYATPTRRYNTTDTTVLPTPRPIGVGVAAAPIVVALEETTTEWCWTFREVIENVGTTRTCSIPHGDTTINYGSLPDIDPATMEPSTDSVAAWSGVVEAAQAAVTAADGFADDASGFASTASGFASAASGFADAAAGSAAEASEIALANIPDADADTYGKIKLAGDLGGTGSTAAAPVVAGLAATIAQAAAAVPKDALFINVKDHGVTGNGTTDDTAALNAIFAALPATGGATIYFPTGVYLCNTVTSGVILSITGKRDITFRGTGGGSNIRTNSATATELLRIETCDRFGMEQMRFEVAGTAKITHAVHTTTASPGTAHYILFNKVFVNGPINYRRAWDCVTASGSNVVYTAATGTTDYQPGSPWLSKQFEAGDVGGLVTINFPGIDLFTSAITATQQYTTTLASDINSSTTSIPLTAPLSPAAPASGFCVNIDNELFYVSAGGNTSTLTCSSRGRGLVYFGEAHTAGAAVTFSQATLADNATATVANAAAPLRIQPGTSGWMLNGFSVGADHPGASNLDLAQVTFLQCDVIAAAKAGFFLGNGTTANVLNLHAYACSTAECGAGVIMNGCNMSWHGGGTGTNLVFFKRIHPGAQEIEIHGVRCDGAAVFWESAQGAVMGPSVRLAAIEINAYMATDNIVINHVDSSPLTLENVSIHGPLSVPVKIVSLGTTASPCYLTAINVSSTSGTSPFISATTATVRTIIPGPKTLAPGFTVGRDVVGGLLFDNRLQLGGGLTRARKTVADANYTILSTDMTVCYTSLSVARVITLPPVAAASGQEFTIKDESGSCDVAVTKTITITPASGLIDGAATLVLGAAYAKATVYSNGTNWFTR